MGNKQVKQHFETGKKTGVLKVSNLRLAEFPPQLKTFPNVLRTLDISENRFVSLPNDIGNFTLLKHLNVSNNKLTELPEAIGLLVKLETINAINNYIERLPSNLSQLKNLKQVILSNNLLTHFPTMLCSLKSLDVLDLSRNKITSIPSEVGQLSCIELNMNQNQLNAIAEELADCPRLKTLRLEENCLPITAFKPRILKESQIVNLSVEGNLFSPKEFNELDGYDTWMERYTANKKKLF